MIALLAPVVSLPVAIQKYMERMGEERQRNWIPRLRIVKDPQTVGPSFADFSHFRLIAKRPCSVGLQVQHRTFSTDKDILIPKSSDESHAIEFRQRGLI